MLWRGYRGYAGERTPVIFAVVQEKGGVGKTTTTINLGAWYGQLGYRTLLIDLDPQGNLAKGLGVTSPAGGMYRVLRDAAVPFDSAVVPTGTPMGRYAVVLPPSAFENELQGTTRDQTRTRSGAAACSVPHAR